jgi:hypothetical protein
VRCLASLGDQTGSRRSGFQLVEGVKRGADNLIHVQVAVLREATDEGHAGFPDRKFAVAFDQGGAFLSRHRVIGIVLPGSVLFRKFAHQVGVGAHLSGDVLELNGAG